MITQKTHTYCLLLSTNLSSTRVIYS